MTYTCSKDPNHQSDDPDYCSICGAKIAGGAAALQSPVSDTALTIVPGGQGGETCPDCGTPRRSTAKFCEVCRYNFETHAAGSGAPPPISAPPPDPVIAVLPPEPLPVAVPTLPTAAPVVSSSPPVPDAAGLMKWEVAVRVDPALYTEPDPAVPCPVNEPERVFPVDFAENLLGRRSDHKDIHPEIPLEDPGVSRRHAKLLRQPDGSLLILDVGSSNGTFLNDVEVKPGVRTPVQPGDEITLGCWTRLTLRKAQG